MLYTFITTVLTTALTFSIILFVLKMTGNSGIHFEYLDYVTQNPSEFFFVGTMISVLGAIMDGTGDIVAGLFGMARQNKLNKINMVRKDYIKSGISIGQRAHWNFDKCFVHDFHGGNFADDAFIIEKWKFLVLYCNGWS